MSTILWESFTYTRTYNIIWVSNFILKVSLSFFYYLSKWSALQKHQLIILAPLDAACWVPEHIYIICIYHIYITITLWWSSAGNRTYEPFCPKWFLDVADQGTRPKKPRWNCVLFKDFLTFLSNTSTDLDHIINLEDSSNLTLMIFFYSGGKIFPAIFQEKTDISWYWRDGFSSC